MSGEESSFRAALYLTAENCSLNYNFITKSFHTPIEQRLIDKQYPHLSIEDIGELNTKGHNVSTLVSVQFCDKVIALIDTKKYKFVNCATDERMER